MTEEPWYQRVDREAAERVAAELAKPMPEERDDLMDADRFHPWNILPAIHGNYSSDFDDCAIEVLTALIENNFNGRHDLAAEMLREMLCVANLCDYGSSPRVCFPTPGFAALLPELLARWKDYYQLHWGQEYGA